MRRRVEDVWNALYRMLEDPHEKVHRPAWHTLEDGGSPDDLKLAEIFQRAAASDPNRKIRKRAQAYLDASAQDSDIELKVAAQPEFQRVGKCDFCGESEVRVKEEFATELPSDGQIRFALVCESCDGQSPS